MYFFFTQCTSIVPVHILEKSVWYKRFALSACLFELNKFYLMLNSTLGIIFSRRHFEIFFFFFRENRIWLFLLIVSNKHEVSTPFFFRKTMEISLVWRLFNLLIAWDVLKEWSITLGTFFTWCKTYSSEGNYIFFLKPFVLFLCNLNFATKYIQAGPFSLL